MARGLAIGRSLRNNRSVGLVLFPLAVVPDRPSVVVAQRRDSSINKTDAKQLFF